MNKNSSLRFITPVAIALALFLLTSCAASNKKYGCPNHIGFAGVTIR
ncbi:MAG TPA: hypothetical protein PLQ78_08905 [Flavipsychrobacter sp.]|jgi:hypothetical protein|nr:hypothetical protein [Flavipsychrobacter sp.]